MNTVLVSLDHLKVSTHNVRKSQNKSTFDELKASILGHGLLQPPLVVEADDGIYDVVDGARRHAALLSLQKDGKLPKDYKATCQLAGEGDAAELSLAANVIRDAMHPADEFEAFAALAKDHDPAEIAKRFGVTEAHVRKRLKLGGVAKEIMDAYRADKMNLETVMAFTLAADHNAQLKVFKAVKDNPNPYNVRRLLTERKIGSNDKVAKFVGIEAYQKAGGTVTADLFGKEQFLDDGAKLQELANQKLKAIEEKLKAEGWAWVKTAFEDEYGFMHKYGRIQPKQSQPPKELVQKHAKLAKECDKLENQLRDVDDDDDGYADLDAKSDEMVVQMEALEAELDGYNKFDPEQMKTAGVYARLDHDGKLLIDRGLVSRATEKKLEAAKTGKKAAPEAKGISQSLIDSLKQHRLQIAQAALASNPDVAFDLMVFKAACDKFTSNYVRSGPDVSFSRNHFRTDMVQDAKNTAAGKELLTVHEKLDLAWLKEKTESAKLEAFAEIPHKDKLAILAYCIAGTLQPQLAEKNAFELALGSTEADVAEYWRPTAENYLSKITRDQLLDVGREIFSKAWAEKWASAKKGDIVKELDRAFKDPTKFSGNKETEQKLRTWLPEGMAFTLPEKKTAKAKKKAA